MHDSAVEYCLGDRALPAGREGIYIVQHSERLGRHSVIVGHDVDELPVKSINKARDARTQLHDALNDRVAHPLKIGRRV